MESAISPDRAEALTVLMAKPGHVHLHNAESLERRAEVMTDSLLKVIEQYHVGDERTPIDDEEAPE